MPGIPGQPAAKPSQLSKPVPGQDALDAALAEMDHAHPIKTAQVAPSQSGGDALDQALSSGGSAPSPVEEQPGAIMQGVQYGLRGLDYAGGLVRTGLAEAAGIGSQIAQGKNPFNEPQVVTSEDIGNAFKGKAPNSAEYLRRLGVPEGGSVEVPVLGKVTVRGAGGLAADILTDPLTLVARTVKEAPFLSKLFNGPGQASEALGEAVYKSALPKKAQDAAQVLLEEGAPIGTSAGLANKVDQLSNTMGKLRQGLYDKATELGAHVNVAEHPLTNAQAVIDRMSRDPSLAPAAQEFSKMIEGYKSAGAVPLDIMSEWKTNLYDALPNSAWQGTGQLKGFAKQFKAALASDFRNAIVETGDKAAPGLGQSIEAVNNKWGALLSATKPLEKATQATGGSLGRAIDGSVLAAGGLHGAAVKKSYDLATTPFAKTLIGNALMSAGKSGLATSLTNRALIGVGGQQVQQPSDLSPQLQPQPQPEGQ